jgi:hypothetical protein
VSRKAGVTLLLAVALGGGGFVSEATATKLCNPNVCREEVAAACPDLKAAAFNRCRKELLENCRNMECSCTGSMTLPACGPTTTTTSTTTSTTTTTTIYGSPNRAFLALPADLLD